MAENNKDKDHLSGVETTGHEWDGLKELNNPAPRWWLWVFFITVIWSVGYWVVYPAWPTLSGAGERGGTVGTAGWTQYKKLEADQREIHARRGAMAERIRQASLDEIMASPELYQFALAGGRTMFQENCASCHGSGGQGGKGYPNLNDDDWIWGGDIQSIYTTIRNGIRSGHADARTMTMTAFGRSGILKPAEIDATADYVLSLSGQGPANAQGEALFKQHCVSCHGADGKGNREMGAPNLTDKIALYGTKKSDIIKQVHNPRMGVMPTWKERLPDDVIKQLSIYVHELGGGEAKAPAP